MVRLPFLLLAVAVAHPPAQAANPDAPPAGHHAARTRERAPPTITPLAPAKAVGKSERHRPAKAAAKPAPKPAAAVGPAIAAPAAAPAPETDPAKGSVTGYPLPRFAALRSDNVNFRAGPGTRYPIDWIYNRRDLPVQIEREFDVWRLVRDSDGVRGWVHSATLTGRRTLVILGEERMLRTAASDQGAPLAVLKPGVVGRIRACDTSDWCQVQVGDFRGYLRRDTFFGTQGNETVGS